jgi:transposase-like protein
VANLQAHERWSTALVEASLFGDKATAGKYDVTEKTIYNWRRRLQTDPRLRELYDLKRRQMDMATASDTAARVAASLSGSQHTHTARARARVLAPRSLVSAVERAAEACASRADLPPLEAVNALHRLPSNYVLDLALFHVDGRYTFCAVVSNSVVASQALGHLLFCYESATEEYRSRGDVRLAVFADCEVPSLWLRAAAHVGLPIPFVNVSDLIHGS